MGRLRGEDLQKSSVISAKKNTGPTPSVRSAPATVAAILARHLEVRQKQNPRYSLRALARDLDVSAPYLSRVMSGKRHLSLDLAHRFVAHFDLAAAEKAGLISAVELEAAAEGPRLDSALERCRTLKAQQEYAPLSQDRLFFLTRWHYAAICELVRVMPAPHTGALVASRLGISEVEATAAIERLVAAKLLAKKGDSLVKLQTKLASGGFPSRQVRAYHRAMTERAVEAIKHDAFETCDFSGITLPLDTKKLQAASDLIRRFRRELAELVATDKNDAVYQLSVQLFRLDRKG